MEKKKEAPAPVMMPFEVAVEERLRFFMERQIAASWARTLPREAPLKVRRGEAVGLVRDTPLKARQCSGGFI